MAGTIVVDRIESDASYASNINVASQITFSNTVNLTVASTFPAGTVGAPSITTAGDTNTGLYFPAADTIGFVEGGAESARFNSSGNLQIYNLGLGGTTPSTSGTGITFPATQSASSDANTLDDYEEGTFTPAFSRSATAINVAYTSRNGFYTRVGRVVTLCCDLQLGAITAQGSGVLFLGALPFTGVVGQYANVGVVNYNTVFDTVVVRSCWVYNNALAFNATTNTVTEYSGNVVASGYLSLTISYTLS